jgi:WD40 repeat protein
MKNLNFLFLILLGNSFLFSMEKELANIPTPTNHGWRVDREIQCEELPTYTLTGYGPNRLLKDRLRAIGFNKQGTEIVAWNLAFPLCFVWDRYNGKLLERIEDASRSNPEFHKPIWKDRIPESHCPHSWPEGWYWKDYDLKDDLETLMLAIKQAENKVCVWDKIAKKESLQLVHDASVNTAYFNRKGIEIITTSEDRTLRLWDSKTGKELLCLFYDTSTTCAEFNEAGTEFVVATEGGKIQIFVKEASQ